MSQPDTVVVDGISPTTDCSVVVAVGLVGSMIPVILSGEG